MSVDDCPPNGIPRPAVQWGRLIAIHDLRVGDYTAVHTGTDITVFGEVTRIDGPLSGFGDEPAPSCYHVHIRHERGHRVYLAGTTVTVLL